MTDLSCFVTDYIKGELLVLIPVLYTLSAFLNRFGFSEKKTSAVLLGAGIGLSALYVFATAQTTILPGFLSAAFTSIVQGILLAGTVIFKDSIVKAVQNKKSSDKKNTAS